MKTSKAVVGLRYSMDAYIPFVLDANRKQVSVLIHTFTSTIVRFIHYLLIPCTLSTHLSCFAGRFVSFSINLSLHSWRSSHNEIGGVSGKCMGRSSTPPSTRT
jgi:hypothetical protein